MVVLGGSSLASACQEDKLEEGFWGGVYRLVQGASEAAEYDLRSTISAIQCSCTRRFQVRGRIAI